MNTKTSILMAKARRPLGCGMRKFGILLTVMAAAIIALPNTVTNDVVIATSDAELRISDRGLGLGLEVVGGGAAEVKLETRPGWRFRDGSTSVTLNKAAGSSAKSPAVVGEGQGAENYVPGVDVNDDESGGDENDEGSVDHEKPVLSLTATAPKVVAYSVLDGGTNVSITLSATVTTKGKHRKLDANGNVVKEEEFSPKCYVWKMTGAATGEAETDSPSHAFTVDLTKGKGQKLSFSVVGKICSICDGEVESDKATDSVEIDVYELSISRPDYLGLDRTDAGRQGHVVKTATLSSDPSLPSSSSVEWTECGICEFVGAKNQRSVSYQNKDSDTASGEYLAERLAASVTLAGMDSSVVCSTNFTVVKVDVVLSGFGEDGDETAIPSVYYIVDEDSGSLSKAGLRHLYPVAVACVPADVPGLVGVAIDVGAELYEITESSDGVPTLAVPVQKQKAYLGCEIGQKRFGIHGHSLIGDAGDEKLMSAVHRLSNAIDHAHVKVAPPPPLEVSVQLNSPAEGGGWPYDPVWNDPEWKPTVDGSLAKQCAADTDDALVIYTLSRDAKLVITDIYQSGLFPFLDDEVAWVPHCSAAEGVHTNVWGMLPSLGEEKYYAKVTATEAETWEPRPAKSNKGEVVRECYYESTASDDMVVGEYVITDEQVESLQTSLTASGFILGTALAPANWLVGTISGLGWWKLTSLPSWYKGGTQISNAYWTVSRYEWDGDKYTIPPDENLSPSFSPTYNWSTGAEVERKTLKSVFEMGYEKIVYATGRGPKEIVTYSSKELLETGPILTIEFDEISIEKFKTSENWVWAPVPRGGYGLLCPKPCE